MVEGADACPGCDRKDVASRRATALAAAYETMPNWPWARFGTPELLNGVKGKPGSTTLYEAAQKWRTKDGDLTMVGRTGAYKTSLMAAIGYRVLDYARDAENVLPGLLDTAARVRFINAADLAEDAKRWPSHRGVAAPLVEEARNASILLLDDLGHEDPRDNSVWRVLDYRYRADLRTVKTSRLTRRQMAGADRYGEDGARRVFETGVVVDLSDIEPKGKR